VASLMDEEEEVPEDSDESFANMAAEAFPEFDWDEERLAAFKEAIRICVDKDKAGAYGAPPKKGGGLDLLIGVAPSKKAKRDA
jgi:hypothetical protein